MYKNLIIAVFLNFGFPCFSQKAEDYRNDTYLKKLNRDTSYTNLKKKVISNFAHAKPGRWGEFVNGVDEDLNTQQKYLAFTFDACGGKTGSRYDKELIEYLRKENIPATLFVSGKWIDANFETFLAIAKDTLFEIENHGLNHRPCSIDGESEYGIQGTSDAAEAFDEIEANARKIEALTQHKPRFYRSATAFIDEACVRMARQLGITTVSFQILSGDAVPDTPVAEIQANVLKNARPGAIVIMHFNHPEWNTYEAMQKIIPVLRKSGYRFVRLNQFQLTDKKSSIKLLKNN
jgi:peptidoglycan/xylan/chitin deacetylase (PgdA/CDA1 family)